MCLFVLMCGLSVKFRFEYCGVCFRCDVVSSVFNLILWFVFMIFSFCVMNVWLRFFNDVMFVMVLSVMRLSRLISCGFGCVVKKLCVCSLCSNVVFSRNVMFMVVRCLCVVFLFLLR